MTEPTQPKRPPPIGLAERKARIAGLCTLMQENRLAAVLIGATSSLRYFTGLSWSPSERFVGALLHATGAIDYVCPRFELDKVSAMVVEAGDILTWEEEEDPYALIGGRLGARGRLGVDDRMALFMFQGLRRSISDERLIDAGPIIQRLRSRKSTGEIALMAHAKAITLEAQRRAHDSLETGMRMSDVISFIDRQHRALGADNGNSFCLVSFGVDTTLPHGGETDSALSEGDVVLIDTGCQVDGYNSDITRTYVHGEPTAHMRVIWALEKEAQGAAFAAARLGEPCESVDAAARAVLERAGLGPNYRLPGLPHRTGHGIGLDVHEAPNLVRGDATPLDVGMCFSNEPMIVLPGAFGVRLEDHFYMTEHGAAWFTTPAHSIDDPFANAPRFPRWSEPASA
jgi:Xaa-Pro dipeptidase